MIQKMNNSMSEQMYTQEQLDIALLKQKNSSFEKMLDRFEHKLDSHFHWMVGLMFGIYAIGVTGLVGALGHAYGWF